ncbi:MAG: aminopeptidase P family protein [Firmicutes bacterium]|nr:aminopeptidase P family protein [Bacillota bacterium]
MKTSRVESVIKNMQQAGMSQLIISDPDSLYYLCGIGYDPGERLLAMYLDADGNAHLFNNHMFPQEPQDGLNIHLYDDVDDYMGMIAGVVKPGPIGIDKFWRAKFLLPLLEKAPGLEPRLGSAAVDDARNLKDAEEIELLRQSSAMNDATMAEVIKHLGDGMSESEMARFVAETHVKNGADAAVDQLVCYGVGCSEPHHECGKATVKPGDSVIFDIFAPRKHYWCDMTRTVFYKNADDEQKKVYEIVKAANLAGEAAIRPGVRLCDIDGAARKVIEDAGYGKYFTHRLGHGCGLAIHEPPDCSSVCQQVVQPGMCFSVEPGVYIPGKWGMRVEDLIVVTEDGCEVLNKFTKDMIIVD